jgi:hypothetical protein
MASRSKPEPERDFEIHHTSAASLQETLGVDPAPDPEPPTSAQSIEAAAASKEK